MVAKVLTAGSIKTASAVDGKRKEIPDAALPGFYLVVQPSGGKSWALRYRVAGAPKKLTIGPVLFERSEALDGSLALGVPMTLNEARSAARNALQAIAEGKDPSAVKRAGKANQAVPADPAADFVRTHSAKFIDRYCKPRNRSWPEVERQFKTEINPVWGDLSVKAIGKRDVIELLDGIIDRGSPVTANRVFATIRKFFGWLADRDVITASPCAGVKMPTAEKSRDRILSDEELRLFWKATAGLGEPFGPMFRLLLVTGQRREEVAGMMRKELVLTGEPLWTIPRERVKNDNEHGVPLSPLAVEIIERVAKIGTRYVFTTTGESSVSGYSRAKDRLDAAMLQILRDEAEGQGGDLVNMKPIPHWTLHDLRRTMASRMAGLNINLPVIEKVLNHVSGSFAGIVGVYQRHEYREEKRRALVAWADYVATIVADQPAENILQMRAAR